MRGRPTPRDGPASRPPPTVKINVALAALRGGFPLWELHRSWRVVRRWPRRWSKKSAP